MNTDLSLEELLVSHGDQLVRWMEQMAQGLSRYECPQDLAQGLAAEILSHSTAFEYQGEAAFHAWLRTRAVRYVANRHAHWSALKRGSGRILRLTLTGKTGSGLEGLLPHSNRTGPATFAERRDLLVVATRALSTLPQRDRQMVQWSSEGVPLAEQAERLSITYAAAQRASSRANERLRASFHLLSRTTRPTSAES